MIVAPVYAAGESPIEGATHDALAEGLRDRGHRSVQKIDAPEQARATGGGAGRSPATSSCAWAPAPSPNGPMPCRSSSRRSTGRPGGGLMQRHARWRGAAQRLPKARGRLEANRPLADLTWFRAGGPAEVLFTPADEADLAAFLASTMPGDIAVYVIGVGSNLLVRDGGVPGVVIRLGRGFGDAQACEPGPRISTGAAVPDVRVARFALDHGIGGLTFLRGIPGTIGGALRMNGGAYGGETKDVLVEARAVDRRGRCTCCRMPTCSITLPPLRRARGSDLHRSPASGRGRGPAIRSRAPWMKSPNGAKRRSRSRAAPADRPSRTRPAQMPGS